MRIVLDTNVVVSAFLSLQGPPARLFRQYEQHLFDILVSEPILTEYQNALNYPKVQSHHRMTPEQVAAVVESLRHVAILISPQIEVQPPVADKDDIKFFACAVAGEASFIISGDRLVQDVGTFQGIEILSPALFLTILEQDF